MGVRAQSMPPPTGGQGQRSMRLKKGELLFGEGENSKAMYLVKMGIIRLFKKKGDTHIELDTVRQGQILGELAFLDGNPRSASAEALTEVEVVEISGPAFQDTLVKMPEWLKILLKTVVARLRAASTRIRQLETASTSYDYSDRSGKGGKHYVFLSPPDVLKIATAVLLVGARNGVAIEDTGQLNLRIGLLQRYCNQIMGIPVAKITTFLDVMDQVGIMSLENTDTGSKVILKDIDFLEQTITYLNEENILEAKKRHDISTRGFLIMSIMMKHMSKSKKDTRTGMNILNLAEIKNTEIEETGRDSIRLEDFPELVELGYATPISLRSSEEIFTSVDLETFTQSFRLQRVVLALHAVNEQKRAAAAGVR